MRDSFDIYIFGRRECLGHEIPDEFVPKIVAFLQVLRAEIDHYFSKYDLGTPSYEDMHYVVTQLYDSLYCEFDNPVVEPLLQKINPDVTRIAQENTGIYGQWRLDKFVWEAKKYIPDVVWQMLSKRPTCWDHLGCILAACRDPAFTKVDLVTLNHDIVIETCFRENATSLIDGFEEARNGFRLWNPRLYNSNEARLRLFKVHGSIDWFRFRRPGSLCEGDLIGIISGHDFAHPGGPNGEELEHTEGRPLILVGTFNKMWQYTHNIYAELFCRFYNTLKDADSLLISGYGFHDKGINARIIEWFYSAPHRKLVVVDPRASTIKDSARPAISRQWDMWKQAGRLVEVECGIDQTSWESIRAYLA